MSKTGRNRPRNAFNLRQRLRWVALALGLCSVSLVGRAAYVQIINSDFYQRQGEARYLRELPIKTSRGMITDRNGEPLAVSTPVASIWVNPQDLLRSPERIPELAQAVGMSVDELSSRLSQKSDKEFMYLRRRINPDEAEKVVALKIPGVAAQREFVASTRRVRRWRTCWVSPTSTTAARKAWSWHSTNGCVARPAPSG